MQKKHNINIEDNIDDNTLINKSKEHTQKSTKFYKPTLEEVREYVKANNLNVDPENWYDYYESNGWHVGKSKMSKWKSCISRWSRSESKKKKPKYDVEDMNADESVDLVARRKELFGE